MQVCLQKYITCTLLHQQGHACIPLLLIFIICIFTALWGAVDSKIESHWKCTAWGFAVLTSGERAPHPVTQRGGRLVPAFGGAGGNFCLSNGVVLPAPASPVVWRVPWPPTPWTLWEHVRWIRECFVTAAALATQVPWPACYRWERGAIASAVTSFCPPRNFLGFENTDWMCDLLPDFGHV